MAFDLSSIQRNIQGPPRVVLYGVPGIGKTTLAANAHKPIFLCTEDGLAALDVPRFPLAQSYHDIETALTSLATQPHDYGTLVIDTINGAEPLISRVVCERAGKHSIADFGWAKGHKAMRTEVENLIVLLDRVRAAGMAVVLLAHSEVQRYDPPDAESYDKYAIALDRKYVRPSIEAWADAILFANYDVQVVGAGDGERRRAVGGKTRLIHTQEKPTFVAKNRFAMPPVIEIAEGDPAATWRFLEAFIYPPAEAAIPPNTQHHADSAQPIDG